MAGAAVTERDPISSWRRAGSPVGGPRNLPVGGQRELSGGGQPDHRMWLLKTLAPRLTRPLVNAGVRVTARRQ